MSRPLRIESPDAWYHVMNRGARRQAIFLTEADRRTFRTLLGRTFVRFGLETYAYCFMTNHFHLLVRTPNANLSASMHWLLSSYVRRFNQNNELDGPLFRGRFKAILVQTGDYVTNASRYIHRNPVAAHIVEDPADYPHSSFPALAGRVRRPRWLLRHPLVLPPVVSNEGASEWLTSAEAGDAATEAFYRTHRLPPVFGTAEFRGEIYRRTTSGPETRADHEALPPRPSIETIEAVISEVFGSSADIPLLARCPAQRNTIEVRAAIYMARLVGGYTLAELAQRYGYRNYSSAGSAFARFARELESPTIARLLLDAADALGVADRIDGERPRQT